METSVSNSASEKQLGVYSFVFAHKLPLEASALSTNVVAHRNATEPRGSTRAELQRPRRELLALLTLVRPSRQVFAWAVPGV